MTNDITGTPETEPVETVAKRLNRARIAFAEKQIKKSGHNDYLGFKYFTLDDIIPAAREVLTAEGLSIQFEKDRKDQCMCARVVDMNNPKDAIVFNTGIPLTLNPKTDMEVQMFGKMQTYSRRYLYLLVLDICEPDAIDAGAGKPSYSASTATYKQQEFNGSPTEKQKQTIRELYQKCKKYDILQVMRKEITSKAKTLTSNDCEKYISAMRKAIEQYDDEHYLDDHEEDGC
jgi:hypothetical protein